jgi:hypothetical protein
MGRRDTTLRPIRHISNIGTSNIGTANIRIGDGRAASMGGHGSRWVRVVILLAATVGSAGVLGRLSANHASPPDIRRTVVNVVDHDLLTGTGSAR